MCLSQVIIVRQNTVRAYLKSDFHDRKLAIVALEGFTESLAAEVDPAWNIKVRLCLPLVSLSLRMRRADHPG